MSEQITLLDYGDRASWIAARAGGIGASDVAALFTDEAGASLGYSTAHELWLVKTKQIKPLDLDGDLIDFGNKFEPVISNIYAERTGRTVKQYGPFCVAQHAAIPFFRATPDRWIVAAPDRMGRGLVQIKKSNTFVAGEWADGVPLKIQIQVQAEMAVTGYDFDSVPVIFSLTRFQTTDVERDNDFIAELEDRVRWFWDLVQRREAPEIGPEPGTLAAIKRLHPHDNGQTVRLSEEAVAWLDALEAAKSAGNVAEAKQNQAESKLRAAIGPATFGELPDGRRISLKTTTRAGYQPPAIEPTTFRTLRIKGGVSLP